VQCWRGRDTGMLDGMIKSSPNWNFAHISRNILPSLRKAGVPESQINTLTTSNPLNYFK
jgi:phosphotriesterase-related protein